MESDVMIRGLRSAGEVAAIARQIARCAEDVMELAKADPLLAEGAGVLNGLLGEAVSEARSMMAVLEARLDAL